MISGENSLLQEYACVCIYCICVAVGGLIIAYILHGIIVTGLNGNQ